MGESFTVRENTGTWIGVAIHTIPTRRCPSSDYIACKQKAKLIDITAPPGKLHNVPIEQMHRTLREQYGDILKLPGMFGRKDIVLSFDPAIFEKVFRTEGPWPHRRALETFVHYRKNIRPDLFGETGGLLTEDGEKWFDVRSKVNPVMLQPKTVKMYIEKTDQVAREFVDQIREIRDPQTLEAPETFGRNIKCWSLESIGVIALDDRLGALKGETAESRKAVDVRLSCIYSNFDT